MFWKKSEPVNVQWVPIVDGPVRVVDIAEATRDLQSIQAQALRLCAFAGLGTDDLKMTTHVLYLLDKVWGVDALSGSKSEERLMLTCLLAKCIGKLTIKHLAAQYRPFGIDAFALLGGIAEFYIDRFGGYTPKSSFRFVADKTIFYPFFPSRFIELYDLLTAVSVGTVIAPAWLDLERVRWESPDVIGRYAQFFGALSVISARLRGNGGCDLYEAIKDAPSKDLGAIEHALDHLKDQGMVWSSMLLRNLIENGEHLP
jgi:hypothetical protein